ncbi:MAG: BMP family ABC transporter substrate-binding protein [Tenericutes bacterium HGW-Tenericutes-5]|nr:MAG: BMP family ABC transporter substrate-binding protein [Tenericutes bacterium HGW-Tenericutes-5]
MKKVMIFLTSFVFMLMITACSGSSTDTVITTDDGVFRVVLLVNGNLGDMSFFDSANEGIDRLNETYGDDFEATTIEMGTNQSNWETTLYRVSKQNYDLIICATTQMREQLQRVSKSYPNQKYLIFDTEIDDGKASSYPNVHSIVFRQNEGGFLAGVLAAKMANGTSGMESPVNATGKVGFIGGMRNNIIYDFAVGYAMGIEYVNNDALNQTSLMTSFVGNFSDSTQAKALANVQYSNNADVIFVAASQAGLGVIDAAETQNRYVIGVDSDQYSYYKNSNPSRAELIITSVLKEVGDVIYDSTVKFYNGELEFGVLVTYGLAEGIIDIADNENYQSLVPEELRLYIDGLKTQIIDGDLVITSRFDLSLDEVDQLFESLE